MSITNENNKPVPYEYIKKRKWIHWLAAFLILVCIPVNFITSSVNPMQAALEECNRQRELRHIPNSGAAETSMDDFFRCTKAGGGASTYFFLTSLMILFSISAIDGVLVMKRRGTIALTAGLVYVILVSLILGGGIPLAFITLNLPIVLLLWWMWRRNYLD
jgi:predicted membrane channel-forming protein YqfA (hemolysin III family)